MVTDTMTREAWKPVPGFEAHYRVSNLGRVMSFHHGKETVLKPHVFKGGQAVVLMSSGKKAGFLVQRLVLMAFRPVALPRQYQVRFIDDNPHNCRLDNLAWARFKGGSRRKLTEAQASEIKALYFHHGLTQQAIADRFGVHNSTVNAIIVGRAWVDAP